MLMWNAGVVVVTPSGAVGLTYAESDLLEAEFEKDVHPRVRPWRHGFCLVILDTGEIEEHRQEDIRRISRPAVREKVNPLMCLRDRPESKPSVDIPPMKRVTPQETIGHRNPYLLGSVESKALFDNPEELYPDVAQEEE